jgi:hypothetical protein
MKPSFLGLPTAAALLAVSSFSAHAASVKQPLHATGVASGAQGQASFSMSGTASSGRRGKLKVLARGLSPGKIFGISVGGVHIGTLTTNGAGTGRATFSNPQKGHSQLLGADPQGHLLEVSDDQGEDVMEGDMPDDTQDQGDIQCCVPDDDGTECEETSPADCTAANGTNMGAGSCFPNPCPTTPPSGDIVCCVPGAGEGDCNEESAADCADENGVNVGAVSCEPDPCAPSMPGMIRCCVPENDDTQGNENQQGNAGECEQLTPTDCTDEGGTSMGPGSCDPNPCPVSSPSTAFLN